MIHHLTPEQINSARVERISQNPVSKTNPIEKGHDFKSLLAEKCQTSELKFSSHAEKRLAMRGIELDETDLDEIRRAVDLAESKGSRDALILHEKAAFVVSIRNRTVITAIDEDNLRERVVTNIDSAVLTNGI